MFISIGSKDGGVFVRNKLKAKKGNIPTRSGKISIFRAKCLVLFLQINLSKVSPIHT